MNKWLLVLILFVSCTGNSDEPLMKLTAKKKDYQDSLNTAQEKVKDYAFRRIYDSAQKSLDEIALYKSKIQYIERSVDSIAESRR